MRQRPSMWEAVDQRGGQRTPPADAGARPRGDRLGPRAGEPGQRGEVGAVVPDEVRVAEHRQPELGPPAHGLYGASVCESSVKCDPTRWYVAVRLTLTMAIGVLSVRVRYTTVAFWAVIVTETTGLRSPRSAI